MTRLSLPMKVGGSARSPSGWLGDRPGSAWGMSAEDGTADVTRGLMVGEIAGVGVADAGGAPSLIVVTGVTVDCLFLDQRNKPSAPSVTMAINSTRIRAFAVAPSATRATSEFLTVTGA